MGAETRPPAPRRVDAGYIGTEHRLAAQLSARHFRSLRLASLRVLVLTSPPLWLQAHGLRVPEWVAWMSLLIEGGCLALAVAYGVLEHRWNRRARLKAYAPRVLVHVARTARDQARAGLWCALAAASTLPWSSAAIGRPVASWLLGPLTALAAVGGGTLLVTEMIRGALRLEAEAFRRIITVGSGAGRQEQRDHRTRRRLDDAS